MFVELSLIGSLGYIVFGGRWGEISRNFPEKSLGISMDRSVIFLGMSRTCPGNVPDMSGKVLGNVLEITGRCPGNFHELSRIFHRNIPLKSMIYSGKVSGNVWEMSRKCPGHD